MTTEENGGPRTGSPADVVRRLERLEENHSTLATTVARVEQNQEHAEKLNELRFGSLDTAIGQARQDVAAVRSDLAGFMKRIESIITGEVDTAQARQGREMVADYQTWRTTVEDRFDKHEKVVTQAALLGSLLKLVVAGNAIAIIAAIAAFLK